MIKGLLSLYRPPYLKTIVYMLQSTEYHVGPYVRWYWRTKNFSGVMQRRSLDPTKAARLLLLVVRTGATVQILFGVGLIYLGVWQHLVGGIAFGLSIIVAYPVVWAHLIVVPLVLGRELSTKPRERRLIQQSEKIFKDHPGVKIAVAGSYGKTTMKELLLTVLSEGLVVAATPANKNVSSSHAYFARKLTGQEDVVIIEYGEGEPGDVARFARTTHPTHGIITGLAPAHLDRYKTLEAAGLDIFSLADYLGGKQVYVNDASPSVKPFLKKSYQLFDSTGCLGWKISKITTKTDGTGFIMTKAKKSLKLQSGLVGQHQVGYLGLVAALALDLGLSEKQIQDGIAQTRPFEHRMQPYTLSGAQIIDDTYNGNLEGIRAGTRLLSNLKAKRKIYVTPGLVDQGKETERVHIEVGALIAAAHPDIVVLMENSVTKFIQQGLEQGGYKAEVRLEAQPLEFYTNLSHFVAAGDLLVMQNDWTDNYH